MLIAFTPVLAACGGGGSGSGSYVGTASNAVLLVQWTQSGNQLTGELEQALIQGSGGSAAQSISNQSIAFTGTINGSSVTLSLNQGLGSTTNLSGTLNGSTLDLNYPGQNGGITTITMPTGNAADFNHDLASLRAKVNRSNNQALQAQAAQQQAQSVQADANAVASDLGNLRYTVSRATGTSGLGADLGQARKDLAHTVSDEQKVLREAGHTDSGTLCYDAGTVSYDAGTVSYDLGSVKYDQGSSGGDVSNISADIQKLKKDNAVLNSDRTNFPADVPTNAPSNAQVAEAINAANGKIASENGATGSALSQARGLVKTARAYAKKAQAACNAGGGG